MLKPCSSCGKPIAADSQTCPHCGGIGPGRVSSTIGALGGCLGAVIGIVIGALISNLWPWGTGPLLLVMGLGLALGIAGAIFGIRLASR